MYIWQCHRLSISYVLSYDFHISYSYALAESDRRKLIEDLNISYNKNDLMTQNEFLQWRRYELKTLTMNINCLKTQNKRYLNHKTLKIMHNLYKDKNWKILIFSRNINIKLQGKINSFQPYLHKYTTVSKSGRIFQK